MAWACCVVSRGSGTTLIGGPLARNAVCSLQAPLLIPMGPTSTSAPSAVDKAAQTWGAWNVLSFRAGTGLSRWSGRTQTPIVHGEREQQSTNLVGTQLLPTLPSVSYFSPGCRLSSLSSPTLFAPLPPSPPTLPRALGSCQRHTSMSPIPPEVVFDIQNIHTALTYPVPDQEALVNIIGMFRTSDLDTFVIDAFNRV